MNDDVNSPTTETGVPKMFDDVVRISNLIFDCKHEEAAEDYKNVLKHLKLWEGIVLRDEILKRAKSLVDNM